MPLVSIYFEIYGGGGDSRDQLYGGGSGESILRLFCCTGYSSKPIRFRFLYLRHIQINNRINVIIIDRNTKNNITLFGSILHLRPLSFVPLRQGIVLYLLAKTNKVEFTSIVV